MVAVGDFSGLVSSACALASAAAIAPIDLLERCTVLLRRKEIETRPRPTWNAWLGRRGRLLLSHLPASGF